MVGGTGGAAMKAALWTKLKSAGPLLSFASELQRFLPWMPIAMYPLIAAFQTWQQRYYQELHSVERIKLEHDALRSLRGYLIHIPERKLLLDFFNRLEMAQKKSTDGREAALLGEIVDADLDDRQIAQLLDWLEHRSYGENREIACWLVRMLRAWHQERCG